MLKRLYRIFVEPRQRDADARSRELVLNVLLAGTLMVLGLCFLLLIVAWFFQDHHYVAARLAGIAVAFFFVGSLYLLSRKGHFKQAAVLLVSVYMIIATAVAVTWGILTLTAILLYGLTIVLAGILIGPLYSLYAAALVTILLVLTQVAAEQNIIRPDWSWLAVPPTIGDIFGSVLLFGVLALVSWLYNFKMAQSLRRAERAEAALTKQKASLEIMVEERTRELQTAQLEKMQQMYRFAELGQLSTALMHDLANHLTTLTLDIENLESEKRSGMLVRAKRSIRYIEDMVMRVRDQLHGRSRIRTFSVANEIDEIVQMLRHKATAANVILKWQAPEDKKSLRTRGEPVRFRQLFANLISNGIDAYQDETKIFERREVVVETSVTDTTVSITVSDWGQGINPAEREQLFEPFFSTKKTGMGMGLFIAKQIVEEHFLGSIVIDTSKKHTVFEVTLPRANS